MPMWWNGRHAVFRRQYVKACKSSNLFMGTSYMPLSKKISVFHVSVQIRMEALFLIICTYDPSTYIFNSFGAGITIKMLKKRRVPEILKLFHL